MNLSSSARILILSIFAFILQSSVSGQIYINEFLASNSTINQDPDFNEYSDWIELYNAGSSSVNLNGYYLTDNIDNPDKWKISQDAVISAKGFILLWTDGQNIGLHTSFKISASGEEIGLYSPSLKLLDSVSFGAQNNDISFGRSPNGTANWRYFLKPTPNASNNTTPYKGITYNVPEYSVNGGLYNAGQSVELWTDLGGTIRYTIDGTDPTSGSTLYTVPIQIDTTTIIRSRIFKPYEIPGPIVTNSYFINEGFEARNLPVVSIATNPENFWDPVKGIYVKRTYKPNWEVPINIELFENNGSDRAAFNELAGTKVNGLYSWKLPQKMLGIYFKNQYGSSSLAYHLFFEKDRTSFKDFALRASGNDWSNTMFRDALVQGSCNYNMDIDIMAFRASVLYVNGQYMGINNMREKVDEDYIVGNHNLEKGTIDMIEFEDTVEAGDINAYNEFKALYSKDLSIQSNYDAVAAVMDIENFTDYVITEVYSGNWSIDHNVMAWKPKGSGKWKWILMDLDRDFDLNRIESISFYLGQNVWPFSALYANPGYKQYFNKRLADHLYTTFNPIRMLKRIDYHQKLIEAEIPNHIARWLGTTAIDGYGTPMPSVAYWYSEVDKLRTYANDRPTFLFTDLASNYGLSQAATLSLTISPANGGSFLFNDLKIPDPTWSGLYPQNLTAIIKAVSKPGYIFKGWANSIKKTIIAQNSTWKYLDNGTNQGTSWYSTSYNDDAWLSGPGKLGYGGDGELTTLSYGPDIHNKYITTYFRKSFQVTSSDISSGNLVISLVRDDGAIVYLNGHEIIRSNISMGSIDYLTKASSAMNEPLESQYFEYAVNASFFVVGTNLLAIEVHQYSATSADLGFDLQLDTYITDLTSYISTNSNYTTSLTDDLSLTAVFDATGECILADTILVNTTLNEACSPYLVQGDVFIPEDITLTIEPGVEIWLSPGSNFTINGNIIANGTSDKRITFRMNPAYEGQSWGALCFIQTTDTTKMDYVTLEDASEGPIPITQVAAISAYKADLLLNHMIIEKIKANPITGRYSSISLSNSSLHSEVVGDLINIKYGHGKIVNCDFTGNKCPDTDAIDYDNVDNGIIKNCRIRNFTGFNSDAIDLGEKDVNIMVDSVSIFNITDKGISIGQRSTAVVKNCTFVNCNLGLGLKDSCRAFINHSTFYGVGTPVACYEKNLGSAGGNGFVKNSILSNSYTASYSSDNKSTIEIYHCISDNTELPDNGTNLFGNPLFVNPSFFNYSLQTGSPSINTANDNGNLSNMGSFYRQFNGTPSVMISKIFYNSLNNADKYEFIGILNPGSETVDLSGYTFTKGIVFVFPTGTILNPGNTVIVSKGTLAPFGTNYYPFCYQWTSGSLSNEGEAIQLADNSGIVADQIFYSPDAPWPSVGTDEEKVLKLIEPSYDNHFGENWTTEDYNAVATDIHESVTENYRIYPNPTRGFITVEMKNSIKSIIELYTISGILVSSYISNSEESINIDLSKYKGQILIIKVDEIIRKIVVLGE
jgi:hypothetical protein